MATNGDDDSDPLDQRKIQIENTTYSVTIIPSGNTFATAWRCPICERRQGCSYHVETHADAVHCAEEEVLAHHAKYHRND